MSRSKRLAQLDVRRPDGTTLYVRVNGPADPAHAYHPPLLLLDGIGCCGWAFRRILPELGRHRKVAVMHYRGHGQSSRPRRPWQLGMDVLAADASAVLDELRWAHATVVGFSMGVQVALELYRRAPQQVEGLVLIAGAAGRPLREFQGSGAVERILPYIARGTRRAGRVSTGVWRRLLPLGVARKIGIATKQIDGERVHAVDFEIYMRQMAEIDL